MKFLLEKQVSETEEIEVELPAYFKNTYRHFVFSEKAMAEVGRMIVVLWDIEDSQYKISLSDCLSGKGELEPCTESEFNAAYIDLLERVNEITDNISSLQNVD